MWHGVLDGEGAAREVQRVLHVPAVLERGEQVEATLECVAVARPKRPLKLSGTVKILAHFPTAP